MEYDHMKYQHKNNIDKKKKKTTRFGYKELYYILFPALIMLLIFKYIPILGNVIAFQEYNIFRGVLDSPFVGLKNFKRLFTAPEFYSVLSNTLIINFYKLFLWIPLPMIFALFLNEVRMLKLRGAFQTTIYLPHFL